MKEWWIKMVRPGRKHGGRRGRHHKGEYKDPAHPSNSLKGALLTGEVGRWEGVRFIDGPSSWGGDIKSKRPKG